MNTKEEIYNDIVVNGFLPEAIVKSEKISNDQKLILGEFLELWCNTYFDKVEKYGCMYISKTKLLRRDLDDTIDFDTFKRAVEILQDLYGFIEYTPGYLDNNTGKLIGVKIIVNLKNILDYNDSKTYSRLETYLRKKDEKESIETDGKEEASND